MTFNATNNDTYLTNYEINIKKQLTLKILIMKADFPAAQQVNIHIKKHAIAVKITGVFTVKQSTIIGTSNKKVIYHLNPKTCSAVTLRIKKIIIKLHLNNV